MAINRVFRRAIVHTFVLAGLLAGTSTAATAVPTLYEVSAVGGSSVEPDHVITCSAWTSGPSKVGLEIRGSAGYSCSDAPDVMVFCVRLEVFLLGAWEPGSEDACTGSNGGPVGSVMAKTQCRGSFQWRVYYHASAFHGNWGDIQGNGSAQQIRC